MSKQLLVLAPEAVGWKSQFQVKKGTYKLSIKKHVARGLSLRQGEPSCGYLMRCIQSNRAAIVFFPDGNAFDGKPLDDG